MQEINEVNRKILTNVAEIAVDLLLQAQVEGWEKVLSGMYLAQAQPDFRLTENFLSLNSGSQ